MTQQSVIYHRNIVAPCFTSHPDRTGSMLIVSQIFLFLQGRITEQRVAGFAFPQLPPFDWRYDRLPGKSSGIRYPSQGNSFTLTTNPAQHMFRYGLTIPLAKRYQSLIFTVQAKGRTDSILNVIRLVSEGRYLPNMRNLNIS